MFHKLVIFSMALVSMASPAGKPELDYQARLELDRYRPTRTEFERNREVFKAFFPQAGEPSDDLLKVFAFVFGDTDFLLRPMYLSGRCFDIQSGKIFGSGMVIAKDPTEADKQFADESQGLKIGIMEKPMYAYFDGVSDRDPLERISGPSGRKRMIEAELLSSLAKFKYPSTSFDDFNGYSIFSKDGEIRYDVRYRPIVGWMIAEKLERKTLQKLEFCVYFNANSKL